MLVDNTGQYFPISFKILAETVVWRIRIICIDTCCLSSIINHNCLLTSSEEYHHIRKNITLICVISAQKKSLIASLKKSTYIVIHKISSVRHDMAKMICAKNAAKPQPTNQLGLKFD